MARPANSCGSLTPAMSASIMARPETVMSLDATESILMPPSSRTLASRCCSDVRASISFLRYRVRWRNAATSAVGMKLGRSSPCSCSSAIHRASETSVLRPGTLRMCPALHTHTSIFCVWAKAWYTGHQ